jgi:hypothetical protein
MSEPDSGHPGQDPWQRAIAALDVLWDEVSTLERDYPTTLERLRQELNSPGGHRETALSMLRLLKYEYTVPLVKDLVNAYLSERTRLAARETLGMLGHRDLQHLVPAAAWQLLEELEGDVYGDDYQYEWIAQLLNDLGLDDALPELARRALASNDPAVRSTGEWVKTEFLPQPGEADGPGRSPAS